MRESFEFFLTVRIFILIPFLNSLSTNAMRKINTIEIVSQVFEYKTDIKHMVSIISMNLDFISIFLFVCILIKNDRFIFFCFF